MCLKTLAQGAVGEAAKAGWGTGSIFRFGDQLQFEGAWKAPRDAILKQDSMVTTCTVLL